MRGAGGGGAVCFGATRRGCLPQASRPDVCCCVGAPDLPAPRQGEGLLLRFFRRVYAPLLLHRVTRVVVVSEAGGRCGPRTPGRGLLGLTLPTQRGPVGAAGTPRPTPEVSQDPTLNQRGGGLCVQRAAPHARRPPQVLVFLALFGAGLYCMGRISVGLDQELALPKVRRAALCRSPGRRGGPQHSGWAGRGGACLRV